MRRPQRRSPTRSCAQRLSTVDRSRPRVGRGRHPPGRAHRCRRHAARRLRLEHDGPAQCHRRRQRRRRRRDRFDGALQSYTIAANDQITSADAYRDIVVAYRSDAPGTPARTSASVESTDSRTSMSAAGTTAQPAVIVDVQRQPGANVIETVDRLKAELPRLRARPAAERQAHPRAPTAPSTIRASIHDVQFTLCLSVVLVVLVVLIFLPRRRARP